MAMNIYEAFTPVRFVPHNSTVAAEVGHNDKLLFLSNDPWK